MVRVPEGLPAGAKTAFEGCRAVPILWPVAVQAAVQEGIVDANVLADIPFYLHHPRRIGRRLTGNEPDFESLAREWTGYRDAIRPRIAELAKPDAPAPKAEPVKPKPKPAARPAAKPRALTQEEAVKLEPGGFIMWSDPAEESGWAHAAAGETWHGPHGKRLIVKAAQWQTEAGGPLKGVVYYLQLSSEKDATAKVGTVYMQSREGFYDDVVFFAPIAMAGRRLKTLKILAEAEMNFLLGVATAWGPAFVAELGLTAVEWISRNEKKFAAWCAAVQLILEARGTLKKHCPTLWDKIVDAALLGAWKGTKAAVAMFGTDIAANIPESFLSDKKRVAKGTGSLLGSFGEAGFKGRLTALKAIWVVLKVVAVQAALAAPGAVKITAKEKKEAALDMIASLKKAGVALSEGDAQKVVEEVASNAGTVKSALEKLDRGFKAIRD